MPMVLSSPSTLFTSSPISGNVLDMVALPKADAATPRVKAA
jgi:hypothetical protein